MQLKKKSVLFPVFCYKTIHHISHPAGGLDRKSIAWKSLPVFHQVVWFVKSNHISVPKNPLFKNISLKDLRIFSFKCIAFAFSSASDMFDTSLSAGNLPGVWYHERAILPTHHEVGQRCGRGESQRITVDKAAGTPNMLCFKHTSSYFYKCVSYMSVVEHSFNHTVLPVIESSWSSLNCSASPAISWMIWFY